MMSGYFLRLRSTGTSTITIIAVLLFLLVTTVSFTPTSVLAQACDPSVDANCEAGIGDLNRKDTVKPGWFTNNVLIPVVSNSAMGMISIGGLIASLSGSLFDNLVNTTIVQFGATLDSIGGTESIRTVWGSFRDIANIVIVGMFVFIAIATILGIEDYGVQKLISRILIVALFINFSLFFTQIIIDVSHFTASQFYKSISVEGNADSSKKISNAFVKTIKGAYPDASSVTADINASKGGVNLWGIFFTGIMGFIFMLGVAALFLYGSFLLASRAVVLVILMITSSLAFASYLIPAASKSTFGWSKWWGSLINAAVMAPLMMIMLWASLAILKGGQEVAGIQTFISDPGKSSGSVVLVFVFSIGLLYASFKISSSLAGSIQGWSIAAKVPALGLRATAGVGGFAGRTIGGNGALMAARGLNKAAKALEAAGFSRTSGAVYRAQRGMNNLSKRDFNFMNTNIGKAVAKEAGLKGTLAGTSKIGGAAGIEERSAKYAVERAKAVAPDEEARKKVKEAVRAEYYDRPENAGKKADKDTSENTLEQAKKEKERLTTAYAEKVRQFQREAAEARDSGDASKLASIENNQATARQQHQTALKEVAKRITEAENASRALDKEIEGQLEAKGETNAFTRSSTENIARRVATQRIARGYGLFGNPETDSVSKAAAGKIKESKGSKKLLDDLKKEIDKNAKKESPEEAGGDKKTDGDKK